MKLFKAFGLKKEHGKIAGGPDDPDYGNQPGETYEEYQARFPKTDFPKPTPHVYPPGSGKREPITTDDASQGGLWDDPTEPGEGVPIHGREETPKQKSERLHQKVERPQSHSSRGPTLADKRQGRDLAAELQSMFKAKFPQHLEQASPGGYSMLPGSPDTSGDPDVEAKRRRGHFSDYGGGYQDTSGMPDKKDPPRSPDPQPELGDEMPVKARSAARSSKAPPSDRIRESERGGHRLADTRAGRGRLAAAIKMLGL